MSRGMLSRLSYVIRSGWDAHREGARSGMCYEDTAPQLHANCSGVRRRIDGTHGVNEIAGPCCCPCHDPAESSAFVQGVRTIRERKGTGSGSAIQVP